jgi:hypothetical protein
MCVPSFVQELESRQQDYTVEWYSEHSTTQAEHDEIKNIRQEIPREQQIHATTSSCSTATVLPKACCVHSTITLQLACILVDTPQAMIASIGHQQAMIYGASLMWALVMCSGACS